MGLSRRSGVGVIHNNTSGRDAIECHPIRSIENLETRLESIESLNTQQQEDIEILQGFSDIDGGNFTDTAGITYEGGSF